MKKKQIVFERVNFLGKTVDIPAVFLSGHIPPNATVNVKRKVTLCSKKIQMKSDPHVKNVVP
jgi:hypothetical protein